MLLFKEIEDFNSTAVNVPNDPVNNTNNIVLRDSHTKSSLPRVHITIYNVLIDGRNFYDQSINDVVKQYDEIRKTSTGSKKKKIHGSGTTTLIISNKEMNNIMRTVQALEDSNNLLKRVTKKIKN